MGRPSPLFRQCPKENVFFLLISSLRLIGLELFIGHRNLVRNSALINFAQDFKFNSRNLPKSQSASSCIKHHLVLLFESREEHACSAVKVGLKNEK